MLIRINININNKCSFSKIYDDIDGYINDLKVIYGEDFVGINTREMIKKHGIDVLETYLVLDPYHSSISDIIHTFPDTKQIIREVKINLILL